MKVLVLTVEQQLQQAAVLIIPIPAVIPMAFLALKDILKVLLNHSHKEHQPHMERQFHKELLQATPLQCPLD